MAAFPDSGALPAFHRQILENEIERLIAMLDMIDGDAEAEPSLGSVAVPYWTSQAHWAEGGGDDAEEQCDDEGVPNDELERDYRP